jgi:oligosaccharide repeat unit polymerase
MSLLLVFIISLLGIMLGKLLFRSWINHLTLYCLIMGGLIFLYELKLLPYPDIIPIVWFFISASFLSFLFGIITITTAKNLYAKKQLFSPQSTVSLPVFNDNGRALKYSIVFFSILGLLAAIQRWYVLINMFGSIPAVLVNANVVYSLKVHKEVKEFMPILPSFIYVAIFFSGIYTAYKGKFSRLTFLPFLVIVLKQMTDFGRAELLLILMEFFFSFFLFRQLLRADSFHRYKFSRKNAIAASVLLLILLIATASFIRLTRGSFENYRGANRELKQLNKSYIISPSIYLYFSSDVGVLTKYFESSGEDTKFGENTFFIVHVFLSRLGIRERPAVFQKGYFIPMWTNTGTYIRELYADFGVVGVFFVPYLIGLIITWLWFKFYEENSLIVFALLVYFYLIIGFSFLVMVTRLNQWYISLFIIIIYLPVLEKLAKRRGSLILQLK